SGAPRLRSPPRRRRRSARPRRTPGARARSPGSSTVSTRPAIVTEGSTRRGWLTRLPRPERVGKPSFEGTGTGGPQPPEEGELLHAQDARLAHTRGRAR